MKYIDVLFKFWKPLFLFYVFITSFVSLYLENMWFLAAALPTFLAVVLYLQNVRLSFAVNRDTLTGLGNKNSLQNLLQKEVCRVDRKGGFLVFLFIDIDNFKNINDTHGHKVGDMVLVEVAERLKADKRIYDELIRYGGDEFCVICSQVNSESDAISIKHKLNESLHFCHRAESGDILVQASLGMATYPTDTRDLQQLISIADCRMYERKEQRKLSRMANL